MTTSISTMRTQTMRTQTMRTQTMRTQTMRTQTMRTQTMRTPTTCCHRTMSSIEVTARAVTLVLHSCTACGRHVWERDGVQADRVELLAGVRTFLEQPRIPTPRRRRTS